jgi:hypothetical protein
MMNKILGLPAGACANAGKFIAGRPIAAKATLETSRLPIFLLIFMTPDTPLQVLIGYWVALSDCYAECCNTSSPIASGHRPGCPLPYRSVYFLRVGLHALCDFGRNAPIRLF